MKASIRPSVFDQVLDYAGDERFVAAGVDLKERIGDFRPEQRALDDRGTQYRSSPGSR